jgi:ribokinase
MIVVFGSINLDMFYPLPRLPTPGQTVIGATVRMEPGGKGANQAVAAARDGATVKLAGAVGRDPAAQSALAGLITAGVDIGGLARVDQPTGMAAICVDPAGQNQIAVATGANLTAGAHQVADAELGPGTTLVLQMETDPAQNERLIRRARARGARIILNLAPAGALATDALSAVDWLVVNQDEAAWLGERLGAAPTAAALHRALGCGVLRTIGAQGLEAANPDVTLHCAALTVQAIDTTDAGDCFVGVFAAALDRGVALHHAVRRANVAAALSCTRAGSQGAMPDAAAIDAALPGSPDVTAYQPERPV